MSTRTKKLVSEIIRRHFGGTEGVPVVDARAPLRLQPLPCDLDGADPLDPGNCVLVHTARRMYNARAIIFWKSVAYVDLIGPDGQRRIERFSNPLKTRETICSFDRGEPLEGRPLILLPPSKKMGAQKQYDRERYSSSKRAVVNKRNVTRKLLRVAEAEVERLSGLLTEAKRSKGLAKIRDLEMRKETAVKIVNKRRNELDSLVEQFPKPRHYRAFDLTSRNGAAGNYKFAP